MLQVNVIREQYDKVLRGLAKRNLKNVEAQLSAILEKDNLRKTTQGTLDELKAQANAESKKIGEFMKSGKSEEANALKTSVANIKEKTKL